MKQKNILIIAGVVLAIAGGVYYFAVIRKRSTLRQYETFKKQSLATGWDTLANISPQIDQEQQKKWLLNLTREDADRLIKYSSMKEKDMSITQKTELTALIFKWRKPIKN